MSYNPFMYWVAGGPFLLRSRVVHRRRTRRDITATSQSQSIIESRDKDGIVSISRAVQPNLVSGDNFAGTKKPTKVVHFQNVSSTKSRENQQPSLNCSCECIGYFHATASGPQDQDRARNIRKTEIHKKHWGKINQTYSRSDNCSPHCSSSQNNIYSRPSQTFRQTNNQDTTTSIAGHTQVSTKRKDGKGTLYPPQIQSLAMSRIIQPCRADVVLREDVIECESDPRPNAFFDSRSGTLRVYHGSVYGNPYATLIPLPQSQVPFGTYPPNTAMFCGHTPAQAPAQSSFRAFKNRKGTANTEKGKDSNDQQPNGEDNAWPDSTSNWTDGQSDDNRNNRHDAGDSQIEKGDNKNTEGDTADPWNSNENDPNGKPSEDNEHNSGSAAGNVADNGNGGWGRENTGNEPWNDYQKQPWGDQSCAQSNKAYQEDRGGPGENNANHDWKGETNWHYHQVNNWRNGGNSAALLQSEVSAGSWANGGGNVTGW